MIELIKRSPTITGNTKTIGLRHLFKPCPPNQLATYQIPLFQVGVPMFFYFYGDVQYDTLAKPKLLLIAGDTIR
jgi:hypothetical protein